MSNTNTPDMRAYIDILNEQPVVGDAMGADPVETLKAELKNKEEQKRALDKEIADMRSNLPKLMQQQQQAKTAQQQQQSQQSQQTANTSNQQQPQGQAARQSQLANNMSAINALAK
jgi:cell division protein FtsN